MNLATAQSQNQDLTDLHVPPHPRAVVEIIRSRGHTVSIRRNRNGSWRYSVNGSREMNAHQMTRRLDAKQY